MNWQTQSVSMLDCVRSTDPRTITLGAWVRATKQSNLDTPKRERPALMPHGMFVGGRCARHCVHESGLIQFDIDLKDNPHLNRAQVKRRCAELPEVYFCANSASGGMWGLAKRAKDVQDQIYWLQHALGVKLDEQNSKSLAALRFASYDPNPYEHI